MECRKERNLKMCICSYPYCEKKGLCCECVAYHRARGEIPGCFFPPEVEKTYDRSIEAFIKAYKR
ncbi:conserved hypothetical cytosolic protein [Ammonifex degensii KC4]|uniref:Conserved hypothetical cytosolic protein n=1 Tax=Ammonifex degensii (strain DSM 10501 / KC4) TaxID=429009 RepID=C9RD97_AMMDK|nr:DUF6485 family protein [Ammonifex degensii]ACX52224.1 conserved hypothetical cytosolic protein [Ammonifex degensii KC4]